MTFFEVPPVPLDRTGSLDIAVQVRETLSDLLAAAKARSDGQLDRFAVAADMSRLSGRDITKNMLDRYCAVGAEDWRFPLEALPALIGATGDGRLLEIVSEACGYRLLRGEEAWIAEFGALTLQEQQAKRRLQQYKSAVPDELLDRLTGEVLKRLGAAS